MPGSNRVSRDGEGEVKGRTDYHGTENHQIKLGEIMQNSRSDFNIMHAGQEKSGRGVEIEKEGSNPYVRKGGSLSRPHVMET